MKARFESSRWLLVMIGVLFSALLAGCGGGGGTAGVAGFAQDGSRIVDSPADDVETPPAPPSFGDQQDIESPPPPPSQ